MLLCTVIRHTALSARHKFFDFGELFNIYRVVADEQDRLIIDINHIFAEHLFIPHVFDADKLFTDKFYVAISQPLPSFLFTKNLIANSTASISAAEKPSTMNTLCTKPDSR